MSRSILADALMMVHKLTLFALQLRYDSHGQDAIYCARFPTVCDLRRKTNHVFYDRNDREREK